MDDLPAELTMRAGERRRFQLPGKAQAGYRWRASVDPSQVVDVDVSFDDSVPAAAVPGRPFAGEVLSVVAREPGRAKVRLAQARSWEPENAVIAERTLEITVVDRAS